MPCGGRIAIARAQINARAQTLGGREGGAAYGALLIEHCLLTTVLDRRWLSDSTIMNLEVVWSTKIQGKKPWPQFAWLQKVYTYVSYSLSKS